MAREGGFRPRHLARPETAVVVFLVFAVVRVAVPIMDLATGSSRLLLRGHRQHTVNASASEVLNAVTDEAAKVRASVLLGTWNHLSPWLVEWSCLQRGRPMDPGQVPQVPTGHTQRGNVVRWLTADQSELVMVLSAAPGTQPRPGFVAETRWLEPVR